MREKHRMMAAARAPVGAARCWRCMRPGMVTRLGLAGTTAPQASPAGADPGPPCYRSCCRRARSTAGTSGGWAHEPERS